MPDRVFTLPTIQPPLDGDTTAVYVHADSAADVSTTIVSRKFAFGQVAALEARDSIASQQLNYEHRAVYALRHQDSLGTDGLQILCDTACFPYYRPHLKVKYFVHPVYVVNETSRPKLLYGFNGNISAYQEARDSSGRWRPIEAQELLMDGSAWALKLRPAEYFVFLVPVYEGSFATDLRVRLQNAGTTYYSLPYPGRISPGQLLYPKHPQPSLLARYEAADDDSTYQRKSRRWLKLIKAK